MTKSFTIPTGRLPRFSQILTLILYWTILVYIQVMNKKTKALIQSTDELRQLRCRIAELESDLAEALTERDATRDKQTQFQRIVESVGDVIFEVDHQGMVRYFSPIGKDIWGYDQEDITGKNFMELIHPDDRNMLIKRFEELSAGVEKPTVYRIKNKAGEFRWVRTKAKPKTENGKFVGAIGTLIDVSDQKRMEEALRESEDLFRSLIDYMHDAMIILAWDGSILFANREAARIIEYGQPEELVGHNMVEYIHPDSLQKALEDLEAVKADKMGFLSEYQLRSVTGRHIWVESIGGKIIFRRSTANLACIRDITDRKRMEEELLRAHKLESLGVLAGGIAHDFNNLMAIVQGYIDLAIMDLPPGHVSRQRLLTALGSIDQTKDLTSRLITFSRGGGPLREFFDVTEIIRDKVHRMTKGTEVRPTFDFMENLWPAEIDELQMKQCFLNLTDNAVESMPEGGILVIKAENVLVPAGEVLDLKEGCYLKITFTDDGIGIQEEHLSKIFDPYFTTKKIASQKGLGLGLSVCYSILRKHDGCITVKSQPGKGTSFILYLPARADLAKQKDFKKGLSTGKVRVLIMDDEPHIRVIMRVYLEQLGYEVTDVKDGQEGIDAYIKALSSGTRFDLAIMDLTVPQGLGGRLTMKRLLKIDPSIKAIIASGYVDDPVIENFTDYGFLGALKKPFKRLEMKYLVEKILRMENNI